MIPIRSLMLCLLLAIPFLSFSQDTLYLNDKWKPASKSEAAFYRLTWPKENDHYKVEDHFLDGKLQMSGSYLSADAENKAARDGHFVYYDHEGNIKSEGSFSAGQHMGKWEIYFNGSSYIKEQLQYRADSSFYGIFYDSILHTTKYEGEVKSKKRTGIWKSYFRNSSIVREQTEYGEDSFAYRIWYDSTSHTILGESKSRGKCPIDTARYYYAGTHAIIEEVVYTNCKKTILRDYYKEGTLQRLESYNNDTMSEGHIYDATGKEVPFSKKPFTFVQQMPQPTVDLNQYLRENLFYPEFARRHNIEGRVVTKFVVNEDGTVSNLQIVKGIGAGCDEAAMRVISEMPKWKPGKQNGQPVKVFFTLPIVFRLENR
ncbi:MAG: TonB family protein [Flavipsychrobacter sp.]|nr:TonB family protein [Flavipsychrobacter sp.]